MSQVNAPPQMAWSTERLIELTNAWKDLTEQVQALRTRTDELTSRLLKLSQYHQAEIAELQDAVFSEEADEQFTATVVAPPHNAPRD